MIHHLSVLFHIPAQDSFQRSQKTLEGLPIYPNQSAWSGCLNTGLSDSVFHQSDLTEILACLVIEHLLNWPVSLLFLSNALALSNDVESVSCLALLHYILVGLISFLLKGITDLISLVSVHLC